MDILHLTLRQLQIFEAVARTGSTAAASECIALSQSATSSAVNELERVLGMRLFDRVGKRLVLNDNGRALLPRARTLLSSANDIERIATDDGGQARALRIGASTTLGNHVLPAVLDRFFAERGGDLPRSWTSRVMIGNTSRICAAVAAFELDIGLIEGPCHQASLAVTPWLDDELVLVSQAGGAPMPPFSLADLRERVWLLREPGSGTREETDHLLLPHLGSYARSIELGSSEAIKNAAAQGLGVACLSRWVVDDLLRGGQLARIDAPALPRLMRRCHWVVHCDKEPTRALRAFIAQLAEQAAQAAPTSLAGL